jgi:glycosyltransferase involved in cell wall biosynthesis
MSGVAVARRNRLPVIVRVDDLFLEPPTGSLLKRVYKRFEGYLNSRTLRNADFVITVTEGLRKIAVDHHGVSPQKTEVIPNGVRVGKFEAAKGDKIREKLDLSPEADVIVFTGALYRHRGIELLLRALPLLQGRTHDVKVMIVGDGPDLEYLKALSRELSIDQDVIFAGLVPYHEVPNYLAAANVAIGPLIKHPRTADSAPIKIFEYMAAGKPIIARKDTVSDKILIDEHNGLQTHSDEPQEIARKLEELLADRKKARRLGENGQQLVKQKYDWKILAKKTIEIYSTLS